ncbi:MAG: heme exporter protein CcmB [Ignavibacteria bacterium]|nr:heme exporter protein CcmB [Ignavibacteria bacterium]
MIGTFLNPVLAVLRKDLQSELRTRYAMSALIMFIVSTISIIVFAIGGGTSRSDVLAGMLWVVIFFSSMSGLSRTFVSEEERGTAMTLQLLVPPSVVLFGKLLFNVLLVIGMNILAVALYSFLMTGFTVTSPGLFSLTLILGSGGLAASSTIIAAIIAKANTKGPLFPVLALPILLPLLVVVINMTRLSMEGGDISESVGEFQFLIAYIIVIITASNLLFEYIWRD